ncbi:F0F1 ATP synthase subunit delta [Metaclostridioides mangenotii]|jgi:F-type H+-transporting ATPase subunit delta|uniref:F0F1 ATP synthase subunit delta n=1 Tax=Metaclostridioides mangenotii TaxID=1540 RepID=UPI000487CC42|nr:F0F1 ATP synthase subunit delta [Clostridioides mangenotii]
MINVVASRYAEALFQIGEEENSSNILYKELNEVLDVINSSNELKKALRSPLVAKQEKKNLLNIVFSEQVSNNIKNFLKIIVDKDRVVCLEDIRDSYKELINEKNNILEGRAISAIAMSENELNELQTKLSSKYNKNVVLENIVDETILGGVLVRLGNEEIDGTVKTRLSNLRDQLSQVIS